MLNLRFLVDKHAKIWREHARKLRRQAEDCGDATVIVPTLVYGGHGGGSVEPEPQLRYKRAVLAEEAAADQAAADQAAAEKAAAEDTDHATHQSIKQ